MCNFVEIGKVVKSSGLKGRLKVYSYMESADLLESLEEVYIRHDDGRFTRYCIKGLRVRGKTFYLDLAGIDNDSAQSLSGCHVFMLSDKLKPLPNDEYYWKDLIGLSVHDESGKILGRIESIIETGANDVYVCAGGKREILIPAFEDIVLDIDTDSGVMTVRLIEGL